MVISSVLNIQKIRLTRRFRIDSSTNSTHMIVVIELEFDAWTCTSSDLHRPGLPQYWMGACFFGACLEKTASTRLHQIWFFHNL